MSYPTSIDSIPQPTPTSPSNNPSNAGVAVAQTNAIVALETKLGTGASTPTSGTVLTGNGTGTSAWATPATAGIVSNSGMPTNGQIAQWTSATAIEGIATTGSGSAVLATSPTLVTPALGTPASGVATNLTGTASGLTAGNVTTNANLTGPITSSGNATAVTTNAITAPMLATGAITLGVINYTTGNKTTSGTSLAAFSGLSLGVTIPAGGRDVEVTFDARDSFGGSGIFYIYSGATSGALTTSLAQTQLNQTSGSVPVHISAHIVAPSSGPIYYTVAYLFTGSGATIEAGAGYPASLVAKVV
jgi:hypothetical protein